MEHSGVYRIVQSALNGVFVSDLYVGGLRFLLSPGHFGGKWAMASCLSHQQLFNQLVKISAQLIN